MPKIAEFLGIKIYMNFIGHEHVPPHIHAQHGDEKASFTIKDGVLEKGEMLPRQAQHVRAWIKKHRQELLAMWETQKFHFIK